MKFKKAIIGVLVLIPLIGSSQILIDSSLLHHSDKWKPKISLHVIANVSSTESYKKYEPNQFSTAF